MDEILTLLQSDEHDVVGGVQRAGNAVDRVRDGDAASQYRVVLDVVQPASSSGYNGYEPAASSGYHAQQAGVVQHLDDLLDLLQLVLRDGQPVVERPRQLGPYALAGLLQDVHERLQQFLKCVRCDFAISRFGKS